MQRKVVIHCRDLRTTFNRNMCSWRISHHPPERISFFAAHTAAINQNPFGLRRVAIPVSYCGIFAGEGFVQ
jgi:hypothetical protein